MNFSKLFILTIVSLIFITMSSVIYATNAVSDTINDVGNTTENIGNGIADTAKGIGNGVIDTAKDIGNGIRNGVSDIGNGVSEGINDTNIDENNTTGIMDTTDTLQNDINSGINDNARSTGATTNNYTENSYTTTPVGYTDTVDFLGMSISRTSLILLVIALAAIVTAILVFAYVSQDNDKYRDNY